MLFGARFALKDVDDDDDDDDDDAAQTRKQKQHHPGFAGFPECLGFPGFSRLLGKLHKTGPREAVRSMRRLIFHGKTLQIQP